LGFGRAGQAGFAGLEQRLEGRFLPWQYCRKIVRFVACNHVLAVTCFRSTGMIDSP
jgi:hypothetical protein